VRVLGEDVRVLESGGDRRLCAVVQNVEDRVEKAELYDRILAHDKVLEKLDSITFRTTSATTASTFAEQLVRIERRHTIPTVTAAEEGDDPLHFRLVPPDELRLRPDLWCPARQWEEADEDCLADLELRFV
jgi:hypothetical protein